MDKGLVNNFRLQSYDKKLKRRTYSLTFLPSHTSFCTENHDFTPFRVLFRGNSGPDAAVTLPSYSKVQSMKIQWAKTPASSPHTRWMIMAELVHLRQPIVSKMAE